jgi:vancomycin resistance protein VanJ
MGMLCGSYGFGLILFTVLAQLLGERPWWFALLRNFAPYYFLPLIGLIPLAFLGRARRAAALLLSAGAVGLGWFGAYFIPKYPPEIERDLRVVTLNVGDFNTSLEEVALWLQQTGADIVLLQELPHEWATREINLLAQQYPHQFVQAANSFKFGNAVLSRHPIVQAENIHLDTSDRFVQQRAVLSVNEHDVAVYNIHLEPVLGDTPRFEPRQFYSPVLWMMLSYDNTRRDAQFHQISERIRTETLPVLVGGDFNTSEHTSSYNILTAELRDSFREVGVGLGGTWPKGGTFGTPAWLPPLLRIDYLWHNSALATLDVQVGPALTSDHLPLTADYALR